MQVRMIAVVLAVGLAYPHHFLDAAFVLRSHQEEVSCTMPSLMPTENPNEFDVTFVTASNYHLSSFFGLGNLYSGTMGVDPATGEGEWIQEPYRLNGANNSVLVGPPAEGNLGPPERRNLVARPSRRGNMIAWTEYQTFMTHYYDFSRFEDVPIGESINSLNPAVSGKDVVVYWNHQQWPVWNLCAWNRNGTSLFSISDSSSSHPTPESPSTWARRADVVELDSGQTRVVYSRCTTSEMLELWCTNDTSPGEKIVGSEIGPPMSMSSVSMNEDFVIWQIQDAFAPQATAFIQAAMWNNETERYDFIGAPAYSEGTREPSLFGSYLVYVSADKERLEMVDLRQYAAGKDEPTVLLTAESDHTLNWPAVWVDENTGHYVVLYESMGSPADLMGELGVIPEPGALRLLGAGVLTLLAFYGRRRLFCPRT